MVLNIVNRELKLGDQSETEGGAQNWIIQGAFQERTKEEACAK